MLKNEDFPSGYDKCSLNSPDIVWPNSAGAHHKSINELSPNGRIIETLFSNWKTGQLNDNVERMVLSIPPDLSALYDLLFCGRCPKRKSCCGSTQDMLRWLVEFEVLGAWLPLKTEDELRRAMILLGILGKKCARRGGYTSRDLGRIAGVPEGARLNRLLEILENQRFIRKKKGKYRYMYSREEPLSRKEINNRTKKSIEYIKSINDGISPPESNHESSNDLNIIRRSFDEHDRRRLRYLLNKASMIVPKDQPIRGKYREGYEFINLPPASTIIGEKPPEWFIKYMDLYNSMFVDLWMSRIMPRIDYLLSKQEFADNAGYPMNADENPPESSCASKERWHDIHIDACAKKIKLFSESLDEKAAKEWIDFARRLRVESNQYNVRRTGHCIVITDISTLDERCIEVGAFEGPLFPDVSEDASMDDFG